MSSSEANLLVKEPVMGLFERISYAAFIGSGLILTAFFARFWFSQVHIPSNFAGFPHLFDIALFALLSYVVWYQIVHEIFFWTVGLFMKHPVYMVPEKGKRVAFLTAFVPGNEPIEILEKALKAMVQVHYTHDTWVLDEGDSQEVKALCDIYGVRHYTRNEKRRYNRLDGKFKAKTKGGNYNSWYDNYGKNYDYVAQIDVDFVPHRNFLLKTLGYFRDEKVGFVGSPQVYGNKEESWIVKGAAEQAYGFFGTIQKGLFAHDMQLFIGANHVVRVSAHDSIEGYSGHIVEDHLTGMKFYAKRWKSVYVPEVLAVGEGPSTWDAYFSQQMRWAYGLFDIYFKHSPKLFLKMKLKHIVHYFLLQQYYFLGLIQMLGILLLSLYFFFGIQSTSMNLSSLLIRMMPLLVIQQVIFFWLQRHNIDPKNEKGFMLRSKLLHFAVWPVYFLALISVLTGKRLTYKVTPKGNKQVNSVEVKAFLPHFILGGISLLGIVISFSTHHQAIQLIFWAILNSVALLYFVLTESTNKVLAMVSGIHININAIFPRNVFVSRFLVFNIRSLQS